jgi:PAS domain-containing protein
MEDHGKTNEQLFKELTELRHATELRQKAEERVGTPNPMPTGTMTTAEVGSLVHEDYRRLTEILPDSIFVVNGDRIAFVNSAGLRLLGASHIDQIVGRPVLDFIHPEDRAAIKSRMQSTCENQRLAQC